MFKKLFLFMVVLCLSGIVLLGGHSWNVMADTMFNQIGKNSMSQMQRANYELEKLTGKIEDTVLSIQEGVLLSQEPQETVKYDINSCLADAVDEEIIGACFLLTSDGREYSYNPDLVFVDILKLRIVCKNTDNEPGTVKWYNGNNENFLPKYTGYYIACINILEKETTQATLYLFVKEAEFNKILNCMLDRNNTAIIMVGGDFLTSSNDQRMDEIAKIEDGMLFQIYETMEGFFNFQKHEEKYVTAHFQSPDSKFKFLTVYETRELYKESYNILRRMLIMMVVYATIVIVVYVILRKYYLIPFGKFVELLKNTEQNLNNDNINISGMSEINLLVKQYNKMRQKISKMIEEVRNKEEMKRRAEIETLRYQINPHFFYNTLSNIRMLAMSKGENEIGDTILEFANLYRYLFSNDSGIVTIGEEIEFIKNYISLMSSRYENQLSVFYIVDDSLKKCTIPIFILQPIVENAIVHGVIKNLNENQEALMRISVSRIADCVEIEIYDNGSGMSADTIQRIMDIKKAEKREMGVGWYNTVKRLEYQYGDKYDLKIDSVENEYTQVLLRIPFDKQ